MRVKKYIVNTIPDAMPMIKRELGKEAVILNTRKIKTGGLFGLFGKEQIEVVAAVDQETRLPSSKNKPKQAAATAKPKREERNSVPDHMEGPRQQEQAEPSQHVDIKIPSFTARDLHNQEMNREEGSKSLSTYSIPKERERAVQRSEAADRQQESSPSPASQSGSEAAAASSPSSVLASAPKSSQAMMNDNPSLDVVEEIKNMRKFMLQFMIEKSDKLPQTLQDLDQHLKVQHVSETIRHQLLENLWNQWDHDIPYTQEQVRALAAKELVIKINQVQAKQEVRRAKFICYVGPSGVGKTTTLAKLSAHIKLKQKQRIGLITSDTYRIAAVEQLNIYATILNIPLEVVYAPQELPGAIEKLKHCDIVLMDTAGRNYMQYEYVHEIKQLLSQQEDVQIELVLSLTAKYEDVQQVVNSFKEHFNQDSNLSIDRFVLTKMDETTSYGNIINLLYDYEIPISYITNGQNVPDDILEVQSEQIAQFIVGEDARA